jgi:hypothetical protein
MADRSPKDQHNPDEPAKNMADKQELTIEN